MKGLKVLALIAITLFSAESYSRVSAGDEISGFLGKTLKGKKISAEQFRGKVLIVSFWATWCPPCLKELPVLDGIQSKVGKDKLQVVSVNLNKIKRQ